MSDRYAQLVNTPIGRIVSKQVGLPAPVSLERFEPGQPVIDGPVLLGAAPSGRLAEAAASVLERIGAEVAPPLDRKEFNPDVAPSDQTFKALCSTPPGSPRAIG